MGDRVVDGVDRESLLVGQREWWPGWARVSLRHLIAAWAGLVRAWVLGVGFVGVVALVFVWSGEPVTEAWVMPVFLAGVVASSVMSVLRPLALWAPRLPRDARALAWVLSVFAVLVVVFNLLGSAASGAYSLVVVHGALLGVVSAATRVGRGRSRCAVPARVPAAVSVARRSQP